MPQLDIPDEFLYQPSKYAFNLTPEMGETAVAFSFAVYQHSKLSLREMEGARYRTAQINGCHACQDFRAGRDMEGHLQRAGKSAEGVHTLMTQKPDEAYYASVRHWETATGLTERERLAIEYAERMGERPQSMEGDEAFWARMHAAYTNKEIMDLTFSISSWIAFGRVIHVLELDQICFSEMAQAS